MTEVKEPSTMDLLLAQIQDYKRQQAEANANRDNLVAQCEGGIRTCVWMIKVLQEAAQKDADLKAAAEAEETLRKEQDLAAAEKSKADHAAGLTRPAPDVDPVILEDAAEIAQNIFDAGKAALQVAQDEQIEARGLAVVDVNDPIEVSPQVHAGELEPPTEVRPEDYDISIDPGTVPNKKFNRRKRA